MAKPRMTPKLKAAIEATREVLREDIREEGWRPLTEDDYESWYEWAFEGNDRAWAPMVEYFEEKTGQSFVDMDCDTANFITNTHDQLLREVADEWGEEVRKAIMFAHNL